MDTSGILQIIAGITTLVGALVAGVVVIIKELRSISVKADVVAADQNKKLEVIHDNGNAHLALMTEKLAESERRNIALAAESNERAERASQMSIARIEKLEMLLTVTNQSASQAAAQVAAQAASQAAAQAAVLAASQTNIKAANQAANQIESLQSNLATAQTASLKENLPAGALGTSEFVQKIEIQQPHDNPVPVVETSKPEKSEKPEKPA